MAEGTSLLRKHTGKTCIVGSNPTASARTKYKGLPCGSPFYFVWTERWDSKTEPPEGGEAIRIY